MTRAGWIVAVVSLVAAASTARLGVWQLDRADQKQQLQTRIVQRGELPPLPAAELARDPDAAALQHYRGIVLRGQWLQQHTVYLDNRQMNGRPGFFVVTPLLLAPEAIGRGVSHEAAERALVPGDSARSSPSGGAAPLPGSADAVLVQRGWMPRNGLDRARLQPLPEAVGEVTLHGRIAPAPSKLFELGAASHGAIRQNLDLAAFSREIGLPLRPLSVQQQGEASAGSSGSPTTLANAAPADNLLRQWLMPALDVGKHHGYAFQWFALCALIIGLYAWFQLIRPRHVRRQ